MSTSSDNSVEAESLSLFGVYINLEIVHYRALLHLQSSRLEAQLAFV